MVLLTMTPSMVEALEKLQKIRGTTNGKEIVGEKSTGPQESEESDGQAHQQNEKSTDDEQDQSLKAEKQSAEPSLSYPKVGNPISHGQVIDISKDLKARRIQPNNLEALLRESRVYTPPPQPKTEPVSDILHAGCWNQNRI
jgi:TMEM199 family protein